MYPADTFAPASVSRDTGALNPLPAFAKFIVPCPMADTDATTNASAMIDFFILGLSFRSVNCRITDCVFLSAFGPYGIVKFLVQVAAVPLLTKNPSPTAGIASGAQVPKNTEDTYCPPR